ncbi:hypothetical protein [Paenibacillus sp. J22TS3]|uniref:hypothetical protein n=1 Tax=Paenibacillus sp. J22TS3 TaxID=2807192 RepID=UPI001B054565|nr:hypothetical protein [Paenibacillus sp. J22TS3]GIP21066.1 hypothetical protein J22TS3_13410 [Paenibacillus sp. J22TS3]
MARYETDDQLRTSIADLTERLRQIRIENGLPPDAPKRERSVDIPLSLALVDRLHRFEVIAIKYTSLMAQGHAQRIDLSKLEEYAETAKLLGRSKGFFFTMIGLGVRGILDTMRHVNKTLEEGPDSLDINECMRRLHWAIELLRDRNEGTRHDTYEYRNEHGVPPKAEADRLLSDPAALQAEIHEALAHINKEGDDIE